MMMATMLLWTCSWEDKYKLNWNLSTCCHVKQNNSSLYLLFRCDRKQIPIVTDIEFDRLITSLPKTQLVVISVFQERFKFDLVLICLFVY